MTAVLGPREALTPELVLRAYSIGVFPMADARDAQDVYWVEPRTRAVLPLDRFHLSRSLRKVIESDTFRVAADTDFDRVIAECGASAPGRPDTWINPGIARVFRELHALGHAHSIECWQGEMLAGGLYGLALGRCFFGESMFSRSRDASKVALAWLVARLRAGGFTLLDCQFMTDHLASLGAVEISRAEYQASLVAALGGGGGGNGLGVTGAARFGALDEFASEPALPTPDVARLSAAVGGVPWDSGPLSGKVIVQLLTQTS